MSSRNVKDLTPEMQDLFVAWAMGMDDAKIDYLVTCTKRSKAEQQALWDQGRTKPGKIVTWTLKSKHITGKAFDVCLMKNGKPNWDVSDPDWNRIGSIGESVGLKWGGRFTSPDFPHLEYKEA